MDSLFDNLQPTWSLFFDGEGAVTGDGPQVLRGRDQEELHAWLRLDIGFHYTPHQGEREESSK